MGLLVNTYIFYADVYFIQNTVIKTAILLLVTLLHNRKHEIALVKMIAVAIGGTIFEIIGLVVCPNYTLFLLTVNLLEIPGMILCLLGKRRGGVIKSSLTGFLFVIIINGTLEALVNIFGQRAHYLGLLVLSCMIVILGTLHMLHQKKMQKGIISVELFHEGTKCSVCAYYDSGNCLKDPYTGKGVHIISENILERLNMSKEPKVCVPYQSLGNETGLLDVYYIDALKVIREKERIELQKSPLGVTNEKLFDGKPYEMILNEEIW